MLRSKIKKTETKQILHLNNVSTSAGSVDHREQKGGTDGRLDMKRQGNVSGGERERFVSWPPRKTRAAKKGGRNRRSGGEKRY